MARLTGLAAGTALAVGLLAADRLVPYALRRTQTAELQRRARARGSVVLTYDDGPSPATGPVLDTLAEYDARATFFVTTSRIAVFPDVVDRIHADGHEVASHGDTHRDPWKRPPGANARDLATSLAALAPYLGDRPLYRPPYGRTTCDALAVLVRRRVRLAYWTLDGGDTWTPLGSPAAVADRVAADRGGVVLLHDLDRTTDRDQYVLEATRAVVERARTEGLEITTMGDLLDGNRA